MTFLTPGIAALFAAVALPTLGLLYFLKLRRRRVKVPTTLLWQKSVEDLQVNTPFQKFKNNILFWLQLLAVCLLLLALARPLISGGASNADRVAIVIDTSASMNATDLGSPRLDVAKRKALALIDSLEAVPISVIRFHDEASILADFTTDRVQVRRAIQSIQPTDRGSNLIAALDLLEPAAQRAKTQAQTLAAHIFTDGQTPGNTPAPGSGSQRSATLSPTLENTTIVYEPIAAAAEGKRANTGITGFSIRRDLVQPAWVDVFAQVVWSGNKPLQATAELTLDGVRVRSFAIDLPAAPGSAPALGNASDGSNTSASTALPSQSLRTRLQHTGPGMLTLKLLYTDAIEADNTARIVIAPAQDLRVLIVTERGFSPMQEAATAYGVADIVKTDAAGYTQSFKQGLTRSGWSTNSPLSASSPSEKQEGYDLVIFDGIGPSQETIPTVDAVYIGSAPPLPGLSRVPHQEGGSQIQRVIRTHADHPLMRYTVMDDQVFFEPGRLVVPDDGVILVTLESGPAIAEMTRSGVRHVVVSPPLQLLQDAPWQWPYQLSFLAFMQNTFDGLGLGELADSAGLSYQPGDNLIWPKAQTATTYLGPADLTPRLIDDRAYFPAIHRAGLYSADNKTRPPYDQIAVNLLNPTESDTRPVKVLPIAVAAGNTSDTPSQSASVNQTINNQAQQALWPWLLAIALVFISLEWSLYTKKMRV